MTHLTVEEYAEGLRRWAAGDSAMSAAVELLAEDGRWLRRSDFRQFLDMQTDPDTDELFVSVKTELLALAYDQELVCSGSELFLLKVALSLMGTGVEPDLRDIVGCDVHITQAVCSALIRAAGKHSQMQVSLN